jgi:predicted transcriptional regulator
MGKNPELESLNDWQIAEIIKAIAEADRGEFATDEEVQSTISRWIRRRK